MISVSQIYFNEETRSFLDSSFYEYFQHGSDESREHKVLREIYEMSPALKKGITYFGVSGWEFQQRTNITGKEIISRIKHDLHEKKEKDVYIYSPVETISLSAIRTGSEVKLTGTLDESFLHSAYEFAVDKQLAKARILPEDILDGNYKYCTNNYFIAKKEVFDDYCKNWLLPAMDFLKEKKIPYYYPTLELLFGSFLAHSNYSFEYLLKKRIKGMKKLQWVDVKCKNTNETIIATGAKATCLPAGRSTRKYLTDSFSSLAMTK